LAAVEVSAEAEVVPPTDSSDHSADAPSANGTFLSSFTVVFYFGFLPLCDQSAEIIIFVFIRFA